MSLKLYIMSFLLAISSIVICQTDTLINITDQQGKKQGHWIKNYPNKSVMYDGFFKDDHPVGEFRRYFENRTLKSLLIYSDDGREAIASVYHSNGYISSRGKYINQKKEGKWQFFSVSIDGYLICEEYYKSNLRDGASMKFFPDSTIAERLKYINDVRQGECLQYYPNGTICLKSNYLNGKVNGKYEVWNDNGMIEISGQYKNDMREGLWKIFNENGKLKYEIEYQNGIPKNRQMDIDVSHYLDSLDKNKGKIADPEKTDIKWK